MKIAVTTNGRDLESTVTDEFEKSPCLLIIESDNGEVKTYDNDFLTDGVEFAKTICQYDCEAVITGSIGQECFDTLLETQVTRYQGTGLTARDAMDKMDHYQLDLIRGFRGEENALHLHQHHHHSGDCDHDHDHD